jgi:alpha,alpha-trehalase
MIPPTRIARMKSFARRRALAGAVSACATLAAAPPSQPQPPEILYGELFSAAAESGALDGNRLMTTGIPREAPSEIMAQYRAEKPSTPEALRAFVESHFSPAPKQPEPPIPQGLPLGQHIDALWDVLTRRADQVPPYSTLLSLPHPYIVPGGQFVEIYYWDSYFTMLGLMESGRRDLARGMLDDFAFIMDTYGHIPNGNRTYYLSRSQPPFFYKMVELLSPDDPGRYLPQMKAEYAYWMDGADALKPGQAHRHVVAIEDKASGGTVLLNRYWDDRDTPREEAYRGDWTLARTSGREPPRLYRDIRAGAESGWDFSSRWFEDRKTKATIITSEILPVDLNSLMFGLEKAIADACSRTGDAACAADFTAKAKRRQQALNHLFWSDKDGYYVDYRWTRHQRLPELSAATLYPLFVGAASALQADDVARAVKSGLLQPGGLVTTTLKTGEQWDSPNGWAPLQWIAVEGLRQYGQDELAADIAKRWLGEVSKVYGETGKLFEKYDVVSDRPGGGGEYPLQDGFGWTNGVTRRLMALYPGAVK